MHASPAKAMYTISSTGNTKHGMEMFWRRDAQQWTTGDKASIILDLKMAQISISVDGNKPKIVFKDISKSKDIKYHLFVSFLYYNNCVEIVNFTQK